MNEGRLEIYRMGEWGTICDDKWDLEDATVACRQLGYSRAESAKADAYYGKGSGTIWMDEVRCRGNEISLQQCPFSGWEINDCTHFEDAGVSCGMIKDMNIVIERPLAVYTASYRPLSFVRLSELSDHDSRITEIGLCTA